MLHVAADAIKGHSALASACQAMQLWPSVRPPPPAPYLAAKEHDALPQQQAKGITRHVLRPAGHNRPACAHKRMSSTNSAACSGRALQGGAAATPPRLRVPCKPTSRPTARLAPVLAWEAGLAAGWR